MTGEQVVMLLTRADVTPPLSLIVQRQRAGNPIADFTVKDVRAGIAELKAAIRRAERTMEGTS